MLSVNASCHSEDADLRVRLTALRPRVRSSLATGSKRISRAKLLLTLCGCSAATLLVGCATPATGLTHALDFPINTRNGLLSSCRYSDISSAKPDAGEEEYHLGLCIGFIKGVTNTWAEMHPDQICPPESLTNEDLRAVVIKGLRSAPDDEASGAEAVLASTIAAFPCHKGAMASYR